MAAQQFDYQQLFSKNSIVGARSTCPRPKFDFAVAYPDPTTLPLEGLAQSLKTALEQDGTDLAYYPHTAGLQSLRQLVAEKLARDRNMKVNADNVVLTSGSGEAISMLIQALADPGDVLLAEEFFYVGTLRQMRRHNADIVGVRCDNQGIIPQDLEATLESQSAQGKRVKFLYTIPSFQNPLGWTMTLERRQQVLDIARRHQVPIFEDDCYVDLRFEGEEVTSIHSLDDTGQVIYTGSFSKILAPGMRMGYLVAPDDVLDRAMSFKGGGGVNEFAALAIEGYLKEHMYPHIDEEIRALRVKRDAMVASLGENFGGAATWEVPQGGLYVWLEMPEGVDLEAFQEQSFKEGVGYYNGAMFSPSGQGKNKARLCFGHPTAETVSEGVAELARIFQRHGLM